MKKSNLAFLSAGLLFLAAGHGAANTMNITTTVAPADGLTLMVSSSALNFSANPGETSLVQTLTTTVDGAGTYDLAFTGAELYSTSTPANKLAASTIQFKESNSKSWKIGTTEAQAVLSAVIPGQKASVKNVEFQQVIPSGTAAGIYKGTVTIAAIAQ